MPDLDWADVLADADRMRDRMWSRTYDEWSELSDADLEHQRYLSARAAHLDPTGNGPEEVALINYIQTERHSTTLPHFDDTLGPCGCVDYHMADCPTRTGGSGMTMDDYLDIMEPYGGW